MEREILVQPSNWVKVTCVMPIEAFAVFDEARDKVVQQYGVTHRSEQVWNGLVLEVLSAEFVAS